MSISISEYLAKTRNFRDVGETADGYGVSVRKGRLFRMGRLFELSDEELSFIREVGVTDIIDLRSAQERDAQPDPEIEGISYHHIDMSAGRLGLGHVIDVYRQAEADPDSVDAHEYIRLSYRELPRECTSQVGRVVELITSAPERSFLLHCAGGKDRTGFLTAVLLGAVGVPEAGIISDFLKSKKTPEEDAALLERYLERFRTQYGIEIPPKAAAPFLTVSENAMAGMLHAVYEEFHGFPEYLTKNVGISAKQMGILKDWLTE